MPVKAYKDQAIVMSDGSAKKWWVLVVARQSGRQVSRPCRASRHDFLIAAVENLRLIDRFSFLLPRPWQMEACTPMGIHKQCGLPPVAQALCSWGWSLQLSACFFRPYHTFRWRASRILPERSCPSCVPYAGRAVYPPSCDNGHVSTQHAGSAWGGMSIHWTTNAGRCVPIRVGVATIVRLFCGQRISIGIVVIMNCAIGTAGVLVTRGNASTSHRYLGGVLASEYSMPSI